MTLSKDDLQAIGELIDNRVRPIVKEEVQGAISAHNKSMAQHFADLKAVMETTYVNREEFEERYSELQNEVDDLRQRLKKLESRLSTP